MTLQARILDSFSKGSRAGISFMTPAEFCSWFTWPTPEWFTGYTFTDVEDAFEALVEQEHLLKTDFTTGLVGHVLAYSLPNGNSDECVCGCGCRRDPEGRPLDWVCWSETKRIGSVEHIVSVLQRESKLREVSA